jgi:hypothetical protein
MQDLKLMSTWAFRPGHDQSPLLKADVLQSRDPLTYRSRPPSEGQGPLVFSIIQGSMKARFELMQLQRLGEYIRKLELRSYLVQAHVAVLDRLMCKMLVDINVLGMLPSPQSHDLPT